MANILDKLKKLQSVMSDRQIAIRSKTGLGTIKRVTDNNGKCKQPVANKIIKLYDETVEDLILTKKIKS